MVNNRDRKSIGSRRKNSKIAQTTGTVDIFETQFAESLRMFKPSWMRNPTRSREMPSCSAIDLAEIRRFYKIISLIWSIISGVVTVLVRPGRGASQVEK